VCSSDLNRSAAIRVPRYAVGPDDKRIEYRPPDFTGNVTTEDGTWNASAEGLVVSLVQNESLIPTGGIVTILNDDTRTIIVRFNENSPTTGEVEISINGSDFFAVNLEEL